MHIPLRAVIVSMIVTFTVSLINIGSATALNAIISLVVVSLLSSYYITISCLVWRRLKGEPLPERRWSLGKYGLAINITSLFFLTPIWFFAFWPAATPVKPDTMNWAVVMYGGMIIWSLVYYAIWARHSYVGPVTIVKRDM
jgi:choline transport protein